MTIYSQFRYQILGPQHDIDYHIRYLNYISYGTDWTKYYMVDPLDFDGGEREMSLVLGGAFLQQMLIIKDLVLFTSFNHSQKCGMD